MNKTIVHTALSMAAGAATLFVCAVIIWALTNLDILTKAYKYPEVIRAMKIEVQVSK